MLVSLLSFQNCGQRKGVNLISQASLSKGGNGGGYDGKPGKYVLADIAGECAPGTLRAKQIIEAKQGTLYRTVKDCQTLAQPEIVPVTALNAIAKSQDAFVAEGRLFQILEIDNQLNILAPLIKETFCAWPVNSREQGEVFLSRNVESVPETVDPGVSGEGSEPGSVGTGDVSEIAPMSGGVDEPQSSEVTTLIAAARIFEPKSSSSPTGLNVEVALSDVSPQVDPETDPGIKDPYVDGLLRRYESTSEASQQLVVAGRFYPTKSSSGTSVLINNVPRTNASCWIAY